MDRQELRQYECWKQEVQRLRAQNQHLRFELNACRPELYRAGIRIGRLEERNQKLSAENKILKHRVVDLTEKLKQKPKPAVPSFVKANVPGKPAKKPGRKVGHPAALRPMPAKIDVHQVVAVPVDTLGKPSCPQCRTQLSDVEHHKRIVEDIVPSKVITTCYHTTSGWCPCCRKQVESRAQDQPPAADLPHAQFGLNALATAAVMRVCYRLPLRQIAKLFLQLPGLKISPGAIVKQIKRLGKWLGKQYHRLKLALRVAGVVHADETTWRTNGKNEYLWTLTNADHTLYHVDRSRSGKVIAELLGKAFGQNGGKASRGGGKASRGGGKASRGGGKASRGGGKASGDQTLVSDFYGVYDPFDSPQQKCIPHLLRELKDTIGKRPELAGHEFFKRCKKLAKDMLRLKKRRDQFGARKYEHRVKLLEARLLALSQTIWGDSDADRLTKRLAKYREKLTPFLRHAELDGTNNAAERALRPAVVMRKITGGSRSAEGARAWAILASVMRTAEQQGHEVLEAVKALLRAEWAGQEITLLTDTS